MRTILTTCKQKFGKRGTKGFTLVEMLTVVAIMAVLVTVAVPVMTQQMEKARESTDVSNIHSVYADVMQDVLATGAAEERTVELKQQVADWQDTSVELPKTATVVGVPAKEGTARISYKAETDEFIIDFS